MYQVIELYGPFEPWWFLEDWKEDIVATSEFEDFSLALAAFKQRWTSLRSSNPYYQSRSSLLSAFWDSKNQGWCEDCDEEVQEFSSLALLKDWEPLPQDFYQPEYEVRNDKPKALSACRIKKIG